MKYISIEGFEVNKILKIYTFIQKIILILPIPKKKQLDRQKIIDKEIKIELLTIELKTFTLN